MQRRPRKYFQVPLDHLYQPILSNENNYNNHTSVAKLMTNLEHRFQEPKNAEMKPDARD